MFSKRLPNRVKSWLKKKIKNVIHQPELSLAALKYIPYSQGGNSYILPKSTIPEQEDSENGFAIPPADFMKGLSQSKQEYLTVGKEHGT